jgi:hypothetical protein
MQVTVRSGANLVPFRDLTVCLRLAPGADDRQTHSPPSSDFLVSLSMPVNSRHELQNYISNVKVVDQSRMLKSPRPWGEKEHLYQDDVMRKLAISLL